MGIKTLKKNRLQIKNAILYVYIFSIILTESTMYSVLQNLHNIGINNFVFQITSITIGVFAIIVFSFSMKFRFRICKYKINTLIILFIYLLIYGLLNISRITTVFSGLIIPFFVVCLIIVSYGKSNLFEIFFSIYSNIVLVLACISLIYYILGTILHFIPGNPMLFANNGWWHEGRNYYYLSFVNNDQTVTIGGATFVRNVGIFMEAPGYAFILMYAFWWEFFGNNKIKKVRMIILSATIFTTFSAKAYISSVIIIIMYLYSGQITLSTWWKRIRNVFLPILVSFIAFVCFQLINIRNISSNGGDSSFAIRVSDYLAAFRAWKDYPLFGCGFYNLDRLYSYYSLFRRSGTSTAGILNVLAYGGIYMAAFYFMSFIGFARCNICNSNKYRNFSFLVLILFSFVTGNVQYSYLMISFMAFGCMLDKKNYDFVADKGKGCKSSAGMYNNGIS